MMGKPKPGKLNAIDREAFERAIEAARGRCEADRLQIDDMLKRRPWREVGEFAAYSAQCHSLALRPWEVPPCELTVSDEALDGVRDDHRGARSAAQLLRRLLEAGLSRYEPDPLAAIAAAERIEAAE